MFLEVYIRKAETDGADWMSSGRVFQNIEAATGNERRPTVDRRYDGTSSRSVKDGVDGDDEETCTLLFTHRALRP